jgi:hypothetical protein
MRTRSPGLKASSASWVTAMIWPLSSLMVISSPDFLLALFFDGLAGQAAEDGADHGARRGARAVADIAAGNAAQHAAGDGADPRLGAFDGDGAHRFDDAHAHQHFAARLRTRVGGTRLAAGARAQSQERHGGEGDCKQAIRIHDMFLYQRVSPNAAL